MYKLLEEEWVLQAAALLQKTNAAKRQTLAVAVATSILKHYYSISKTPSITQALLIRLMIICGFDIAHMFCPVGQQYLW